MQWVFIIGLPGFLGSAYSLIKSYYDIFQFLAILVAILFLDFFYPLWFM